MAISYLRGGRPGGPRIIYVHGTAGSALAWQRSIEGGLRRYEHIALDRPGFGRSRPPGALVSLKAQASALEPFLERRAGRLPVLVGHSLGAAVIVRAALDFPGRVGALVIAAGLLDPALEKVHFMQPLGGKWPVRGLLPRMLRNSNLELLALRHELKLLARGLPRVRVPVVILHGTRDKLASYGNVSFMKRNFSSVEALEVTILEGRNHFLPWNARSEIETAVVRAFELAACGGP